jgi:RNA polymerase sigma-70 factor, ECF subfamily
MGQADTSFRSHANQEGMNMSSAVPEFQSIHDTFRPRILRYLTRFVGEDEAEDLTQTVMVKVSKGLRNFRGDSTLSTWIYRVATNTALDQLRNRAMNWTGHQSGSTGIRMESEVESVESGIALEKQTPSIEATIIRKEMNECIREFVDRLPENYKTVMVLSELEGFQNSEIAEILGISLDTVKIRLHRARDRLRKELGTGCNFFRDERNEFACDRKP